MRKLTSVWTCGNIAFLVLSKIWITTARHVAWRSHEQYIFQKRAYGVLASGVPPIWRSR